MSLICFLCLGCLGEPTDVVNLWPQYPLTFHLEILDIFFSKLRLAKCLRLTAFGRIQKISSHISQRTSAVKNCKFEIELKKKYLLLEPNFKETFEITKETDDESIITTIDDENTNTIETDDTNHDLIKNLKVNIKLTLKVIKTLVIGSLGLV